MEHDFYQTWRRYQRLLSQRNASLKQGATNLFAWDDSLAETGEAIGRMRQTYVTSLSARIIAIATRLLDREAVDIKYRPGWSDADGLRAALRKTELQDRARGFTGAGPHRAELEVFLAGRPAAQSASRGQLKLLVSALVVGQLEHLRDEAKVHAVVLIDELPAELDENSRTRLISLVGELGMQTFISAIDPESVEAQSWGDPSLFHVEQGRIAQVV